MASERKIGIGLVGIGTVGAATAELLYEERELLARRVGADVRLVAVCDKRFKSLDEMPKGIGKPRIVGDFKDLVADKEVDIVVELMGGTGVAKELALRVLGAGKPLVTANKALLALHGDEIFAKAAEKGVPVGFEASVAGGVPILRALREGISGDRVTSVRGIVNGTSNFILSEMSDRGESFEKVLKEAQKAGYAEADPTFDIEGVDAAHKLALLAGLSFGTRVNFKDIYTEGISKITAEDIAYGKRLGYRVKLLAIAKHQNGAMELRVHPVLLPEGALLAQINGVLNGIEVQSVNIGTTHYTGRGAGGPATSGAVVSDIVAIARSLLGGKGALAPPRLVPEKDLANIPVRGVGEIESAYYLRFTVRDRPGVLAKITGILGEAGVSIAELMQPLRSKDESVPILVMTHRCSESAVAKALPKINALDVVTAPTAMIRVEDERL